MDVLDERRSRHGIQRGRVAMAVLLTVSLLLSLEVGAYLFLRTARARNPLLFQVTPRELAEQVRPTLPAFLRCEAWVCPHPVLGWRHQPGTHGNVGFGPITADQSGSRVVPGAEGPVLVSTYGDSFTQGIEVDDASTFQAHLSRLTRTRVQNFGMMGFGPDQALLYLRANLARGDRVPIVVLGMVPENVNRLMSAFRPFYTHPALDIPLGFKPVLVKAADGYQFRNFAPSNPLDAVELERAIARAGEFDAFRALRSETADWPFSVSAARYLMKYGLKPRFRWPGETREAHERLKFVLEDLWRLSRSHGFLPVLLLMPMSERELDRAAVPGMRRGLDLLEPDAAREIVVVDIAKERRGLPGPGIPREYRPYITRTHPSAQGNRLIADLLLRRLCAEPGLRAAPDLAGRLCSAGAGGTR